MSELFGAVGIRSNPGREGEPRRDLATLVEPSRSEVGNLLEDVNEPGKLVFVERWESADAQRLHHEQGSHIRHFHENGEANAAARDFVHMLRLVSA